MEKKRNVWKALALVLMIIAIGVAGFLTGQYLSASKYRAEQELNNKLNRSDLEGLGEIDGTIYVTGHKSPDSDTVGSSIAYAALLQKLGYDAVPVVLEDINNETRYVLESGGIDTPKLLEDASGCNMILVDHSEYAQSAEGLRDANVISIIDHHGDGSVTTGNQLIYDARPLGSTATIIWIRYRNYGVEVDPHVAYAMVGSILSDTNNLKSNSTTTNNLKSNSTTFADREALKALAQLAGINNTTAFHQKMFQASISYDGMTDEEIFFDDYKEYECGGKKYGIGCVNAYDEDAAKDLCERMNKVLPGTLSSTGMDMAFEAFGEKATYDGVSYRLEPGISRRQVLVPAITDILESYPHE